MFMCVFALHCSPERNPRPQPLQQLVEPRFAEATHPVLPVPKHPQLTRVGTNLVVVASFEKENVTGRVTVSIAAGWVVAIARAYVALAMVRFKVARRLGKA